MAKYTLPTFNNGYDDILVGTAATMPSFVPMVLLFVWGSVFVSGFVGQKRRSGVGDAPMWATMASLSTFLIALIFSLRRGLIDVITLNIVLAVTILSGLWLFWSKGRFE